MIFVVGDLHLSFSTDKPMDRFGDEWKEHHVKIREDWLSKVRADDAVILAGDTSWSMRYEDARIDFAWVDELPGKKIIIKGNHDYWWNFRSKLAAEFKSLFFLSSNSYEYGRFAIVGSRGWDIPNGEDGEDARIYRRELVRLENSLKSAGQNRILIAAVHYPPSSKGEETEVTKLLLSYGAAKVYYGHLHGEQGFAAAYNGLIGNVSYELISCDYTRFNLVKVCDASPMNVDDTDFDGAAQILEDRLAGIARLTENGDKHKFLDANFELSKRTALQYVHVARCGDFSGEEAFLGGRCVFAPEDVDSEVYALLCIAVDMSERAVRSVADGIIKYNFLNALAKKQMFEADVFEYSNFERFLAMRRVAHYVYELKDKVTLGLCRKLLSEGFALSYYRIRTRSEALSGRIYEIVSDEGEKIVLHTMSADVVDFLRTCGIMEGAEGDSKISAYVNKRLL